MSTQTAKKVPYDEHDEEVMDGWKSMVPSALRPDGAMTYGEWLEKQGLHPTFFTSREESRRAYALERALETWLSKGTVPERLREEIVIVTAEKYLRFIEHGSLAADC